MPHDQSDEFEQNLSRQPVRRIPGEWRADILAAARDAQMSRNGSAVTSHSGLSTLSVNQELDLGKGEARPFHELEVGLGHVGSPPSPRPSPPGRGRNAPSVLAICRRWVGVGSRVQCANGSGKSHPGPLPRGERETLPAAWRNVASSIQAFNARMVRGNLSQHLSALLWPHPKAWAGLAAVWILIAGLNLSTRDPSPRLAVKTAAPSPTTLVELRQQHRLYAELLGRMDAPDADRPRLLAPKPRSERVEILAT